MNGIRLVDSLTQDLRDAFRQLRHGPGFSAVVVGTLALGIGGTTAVFSVMHAVLLAPLPYAQPDQLVRIYQQEPGKPDTRRAVSAPQFRMVRGEAASFSDVAARYVREDLGLDLSKDGDGQRLRVLMVTSDYFRTLRPEQFQGPGFQIEDEKAGARRDDRSGARRVVLSNTVWRERFNGDPSIDRNDDPAECGAVRSCGNRAGRLPGSDCGSRRRVAALRPRRRHMSENNSLAVFGRLRTGVGMEQALAELAVLSESAKQRWPEAKASSIVAQPLQHDVAAPSRALLQLLVHRRRARAAGRVRERRQSGPRSRDRPGPGVRGPRGARLQPQPTGPATPDRKLRPGGIRWHRRARAGSTRCQRPPDARPRRAAAARLGRLQPGRAAVRRRGHDGDGVGVRRDAGAASGEERSESLRSCSSRARRPARADKGDCEAASPPRNSRSRWRSSPAPASCR